VLNAADPIFDPGSSQYIGTTVPYNPFGDYRAPIATNRKLIDYVIAETAECDLGTLATFDFNIYTTALFRLPAGGIGVAVGAQFQHETNDQNPGALLLNGDLVGDFQYYPVHGKRDTYAAYAEASIPVFGANFTAPGLHALDFTAAGRYEEFLNNGTNVMVPKLGLRWQPLDDSLTFRATWGEGYKQPTLVQLFAPVLSGQIDVFDPVNAAFVPAVTATLVPNPNLQPEDSRNVSAGIVYSPKFVPGLTVTLDMFGIETTGWVTIPNPSDVIARVGAGHPLPLEAVTRDANGNLTSFTATFVNTGTQKARGADLGVAYQIQTSFGTFTSTTQTTFLDSFQFSPTPVEAERELRSRPLDNFSDDAYLKWKASSRVDWTWRGFGSAVTANYRDGFHELTAAGNEHWVRQTCLFDLQVSYEFGVAAEGESEQKVNRANGSGPRKPPLDGTSIRIGCTNVFDHDPPRANDNFPRFLYDPTGRFVYLSVTKRF
jgi:iron complex outermembrane receptor protein